VIKGVKTVGDKKKVTIESVWGSTIHHLDDLPYNPKEYLPHIYGKFREKGADIKVRDLLPTPKSGDLPFLSKPCDIVKQGVNHMPTLADFGFSKEEISSFGNDKRACYKFVGGEDQGLKRIEEYILTKRSVRHYNDTRNNLIGSEYSSKLSPWLANGSISIREVYWKVKEFEKSHGANESTKVFIDELFWRDFYRFWCMRYKNKVFSSYGIYDRSYYAWETN
jgi:deoxyribodipyrimidine photo-lyase